MSSNCNDYYKQEEIEASVSLKSYWASVPRMALAELALVLGRHKDCQFSCPLSVLVGPNWRFPKIWGTILGVPILRIIVYWGLYWGPLI